MLPALRADCLISTDRSEKFSHALRNEECVNFGISESTENFGQLSTRKARRNLQIQKDVKLPTFATWKQRIAPQTEASPQNPMFSMSRPLCYDWSTMWRIASTSSVKLAFNHCIVTSTRNAARRASSSLLVLSWKPSSCGWNARSFDAGNLYRQLASFGRCDNRRFFSSTRRGQPHQPKTKSKQTEINGRIIALGRINDWAGILDLYMKEKEQFNQVNYGTSMTQLARIQSFRRDDRRLEDMMMNIATQLQNPKAGSWGARRMATVLHAVAKMQLESNATRELTDSILGEANINIFVEDGNVQAIANSAWACAKLGIRCPLLFNAIDNNALYLVDTGNFQEIANMAWACAKLGVHCPLLFNAIDDNASYLVDNGNIQDIANTAWACATLGIPCPSLFKAIDNHALYLVKKGNSQDIANAVWACATLGVECSLLFEAINSNALSLIENGNSQEIANTAWACATLGVHCPLLFHAIDNHALYLVQNGLSHNIANTAWACAIMGAKCPSFFKAVGSHMETLIESCNAQDIANICYSFAILDLALEHEAKFRILWDRATLIKFDDLNKDSSWQLLQTFVVVSRVMQLPPPIELMKHLDSLRQDEKSDSRSQKEMSQLLNEMGVSHEMEASPFPAHAFVPGLFAIDAACKEHRLAIEFDGPFHFLKTVTTTGKYLEGRVETGPSKAKRRFLERLGWKVVNVRYWEWASANFKDEKKKLLSAKLLAVNDISLA